MIVNSDSVGSKVSRALFMKTPYLLNKIYIHEITALL